MVPNLSERLLEGNHDDAMEIAGLVGFILRLFPLSHLWI
jgi:hypothetical protein